MIRPQAEHEALEAIRQQPLLNKGLEVLILFLN